MNALRQAARFVPEVVPATRADLLAQAVEPLLERHGVEFKRSRRGETSWFNFRLCPVCEKGRYECGVSERRGRHGNSLMHAVKCLHQPSPTYDAFLAKIGVVVPELEPTAAEASEATLDKRMRRLRNNEVALGYLIGRGLRAETLERFRLGLSEPYLSRDGILYQDAVTVPLLMSDGSIGKRNAYYRVPGLTLPDGGPKGWMKGEVSAYFGDRIASQAILVVAEGMKDVWRLWQELDDWSARDTFLLVSSTHSSALPQAWQGPEFWKPWRKVILSHDADDAGDRMALAITAFAQRECLRVHFPGARKGYDWTDWLNDGKRSLRNFLDVIEGAEPVKLPNVQKDDDGTWDGDYQVERINAHGAFVTRKEGGQLRRYLYYATEVESRRTILDEGAPVAAAYYKTIVVRSDRTRHEARLVPVPKGARGRPVLELYPDGVRLEREPVPMRGSWKWKSIQAFLEDRAFARPLSELLGDVEGHLKARVWLPHAEDYAMLAAGLAVSYCQTVFVAVPIFLVVGPPGTGKTALSRITSQLGANGYLIGQASAATAARVIDQTRGFVAFDDLEQIASKTGDDATFSDLVQALKLSYNQDTAVKEWTDTSGKTMQTRTLNYFGVKLIGNTRGADDILGSRMLRIHTRVLSPSRKAAMGGLPAVPHIDTDALRQELHVWAFTSVEAVADTYLKLFDSPSNRAEEIAAPIRVMAQLAGDQAFKERIELALARQAGPPQNDDPGAALTDIVRRLVLEGYRTLSPVHLRMELSLNMDARAGKEQTTDIPQWQRPEWVGRLVRDIGAVEFNVEADKPRAPLSRYQLRIYPIRREYMVDVLGQANPIEVSALAFCDPTPGGCQQCRFRVVDCPILPHRTDSRARVP